jgi:AcrR family transcriptional regulator
MTRKTTASEARRRPQRVDAQRNVDALLDAAKSAFAALGVDAPARDIAERAGVGVGTMYRHFPRRSDLVVAVLEHEIDACAEAGPALSAAHEADEALTRWLRRYTDFVATKHGLAAALHSGDPAFDALPAYFWERLGPVLDALLEAAKATGEIRADISARDLLSAVALLCHPVPGEGPEYGQRMVALLIDGLHRAR